MNPSVNMHIEFQGQFYTIKEVSDERIVFTNDTTMNRNLFAKLCQRGAIQYAV
jgi:hypothetical protein